MDHYKIKQPTLPASTPTAAGSKIALENIYGGRTQTNHTSNTDKLNMSLNLSSSQANMNIIISNDSSNSNDPIITKSSIMDNAPLHSSKSTVSLIDNRVINKLVAKLPDGQLRESVMSIVNISVNYASSCQSSIDALKQDVHKLKAEIKKKVNEADSYSKLCSIYKDRLRVMEDNSEILKDSIQDKDNIAVKHKNGIARLARTNRMLIDILHALQVDTTSINCKAQGLTTEDIQDRSILLRPMSTNGNANDSNVAAINGTFSGDGQAAALPVETPEDKRKKLLQRIDPRLLSNQLDGSKDNIIPQRSNSITSKFGSLLFSDRQMQLAGPGGDEAASTAGKYTGNDVNGTAQSDNLRESLLRVAREHLKQLKGSEMLEEELLDLRDKLKGKEKEVKLLKIEIDDLKIKKGVDSNDNSTEPEENVSIVNKLRYYNKIDDRFKLLIDRHTIDTSDALIRLRRIVGYLVEAPPTLNFTDLISYVTCKNALNVFEVEGVCIFLKHETKHGSFMHKYTARSSEPEIFSMESKSLAADILTYSRIARLNSLARVNHYRQDIDGFSGLVVKKILSLPMKFFTETFGTIHFLNRENNVPFSEADEIFFSMCMQLLSNRFQLCMKFDKVIEREETYKKLITASEQMLPIFSFSALKKVELSEILIKLQDVAVKTLRLAKCKTFINSKFCNKEDGTMVTLDTFSSDASSSSISTKIVSMSLGIAGHVMQTGASYIYNGDGQRINSFVDCDPLLSIMYTVPIKNWEGGVLACVQMVLSSSSAKFYSTDDSKTGNLLEHVTVPKDTIYFPDASQILCDQLSHVLVNLLSTYSNQFSNFSIAKNNFHLDMMTGRASLGGGASIEALKDAQAAVEDTKKALLARDESSAKQLAVLEQQHQLAINALNMTLNKMEKDKNEAMQKIEAMSAQVDGLKDENKGLMQQSSELLSKMANSKDKKGEGVKAQQLLMQQLENAHKKDVDEVTGRYEQVRIDVAKRDSELEDIKLSMQRKEAEFNAVVAALKKESDDKTSIITILQDQLVKMANDEVVYDVPTATGGGNASTSIQSTVPVKLPPDWAQFTDDAGNIYYFNSVTNESTWDIPQ